MAKVTLYRDKRDGVICLRFNNMGTHSQRALGVTVDANQWADGRVVNHPQREELNATLSAILAQARVELLRIVTNEPTRNTPPTELRDRVCRIVLCETEKRATGFFDIFEDFIHTHENAGTRAIYNTTRNILARYDSALTFEKITVKWLQDFRRWMILQGYSTNYRSIQERNLRAVVNYALDLDMPVPYAFRRYSIESEHVEVRDLTSEEVRRFITYDGPLKEWADIFVLEFFLLGINISDMYELTAANVSRGRIRYTRNKTGKHYNIKIEPELAAILKKYKGREHLLSQFDGIGRAWAAKKYNAALKELAKELRIRLRFTSYVSRYSWASIAYNELQIPMDTISQALGHSYGKEVTRGYTNFNAVVVDEANRRVFSLIYGNFSEIRK